MLQVFSASIVQACHEYRARGLALVRIRPGQKRPSDANWTRRSAEPGDFSEEDSVGIQTGRLSDDLVCLDLDCHHALARADDFLPKTEMEEGRPGKPRSHRYYRVRDIPDWWTATCAGGLGGPQTALFRRGPGDVVVEFRGTGSQVVAPPSPWVSRDGARSERREWHAFGAPAEIGCVELLESVARFAAEFGGHSPRWEQAARPGQTRARREQPPGQAPELLPLPAGEAVAKARAYVRKLPPSVIGQGGNAAAYRVACVLTLGFALPAEEALPLYLEWNERCAVPWPLHELENKLRRAGQEPGPRGVLLRARKRRVEVRLRAGDREVLVGVGVAGADASFADLYPDLWAACYKQGHTYRLCDELAAIDWRGKSVLLVPPSNVATNKAVVWDEFQLARLLREAGAVEVQALRLPPREGGRKRTYADVLAGDEVEVEVGTPPANAKEVEAAQEKASANARAQAASRRSAPRQRQSPALAKAKAWLEKHGVSVLSKEVVQRAKEDLGVSAATLKRAFRAHVDESNLTLPSSFNPIHAPT
jgi:hypothetical protein